MPAECPCCGDAATHTEMIEADNRLEVTVHYSAQVRVPVCAACLEHRRTVGWNWVWRALGGSAACLAAGVAIRVALQPWPGTAWRFVEDAAGIGFLAGVVAAPILYHLERTRWWPRRNPPHARASRAVNVTPGQAGVGFEFFDERYAAAFRELNADAVYREHNRGGR